MNFELLPNETILDLFEYIPIFDLFHGFYNINSRFNRLLQFRKFHLDFRLLSKMKCTYMCENYVPLVIDRVISLHLSDDDDTPRIMELFLSQPFQLRQFTHLQSITISFIQSDDIMDKIMMECSHLPYLTRLIFIDGDLQMNETDAYRFYNDIWSLKNLTYCLLNIWFLFTDHFRNPTIISTSLKHLIIPNLKCSLSTLSHLCHYTPNLEHLSIKFNDRSNEFNSISPIQSICRLNIDFTGSIDILKQLLQNLPNLSHLKWEAHELYINGYQWEKMIRQCIPKLEVFQFKMKFLSSNDNDKEIELNKIIATYRTKFWIEEHQWFVRCDWCDPDYQNGGDRIYLFTLPYSFRDFVRNGDCILTKSTGPFDDQNLVCDKVTYLYYNSSSFMSPISSRVRFNNVKTLLLLLPFNDQFLSVVTKLDQVIFLHVFIEKDENIDKIQSQLQFLLNQARRIRSLSFGKWLPPTSPVPPMEVTSVSVCQLLLARHTLDDDGRCYDDDACTQLCLSYLGKQCEVLMIRVKNRRSILDLVNNMPHLQSIKVRCDDETVPDEQDSVKDELLEWFRQHLPLKCSITRDNVLGYDIRIWIG